MNKNPSKITVSDALIRAVMTSLGQRTSEKKAAAARRNGALGGRPRKQPAQASSK